MHQWLMEHHNPQIVLVSYARLTENPLPQLDALYRQLGLEVSKEGPNGMPLVCGKRYPSDAIG